MDSMPLPLLSHDEARAAGLEAGIPDRVAQTKMR